MLHQLITRLRRRLHRPVKHGLRRGLAAWLCGRLRARARLWLRRELPRRLAGGLSRGLPNGSADQLSRGAGVGLDCGSETRGDSRRNGRHDCQHDRGLYRRRDTMYSGYVPCMMGTMVDTSVGTKWALPSVLKWALPFLDLVFSACYDRCAISCLLQRLSQAVRGCEGHGARVVVGVIVAVQSLSDAECAQNTVPQETEREKSYPLPTRSCKV